MSGLAQALSSTRKAVDTALDVVRSHLVRGPDSLYAHPRWHQKVGRGRGRRSIDVGGADADKFLERTRLSSCWTHSISSKPMTEAITESIQILLLVSGRPYSEGAYRRTELMRSGLNALSVKNLALRKSKRLTDP